jgi:hypothetical protein
MRRVAGRAPDPNRQEGRTHAKPVRDLMQIIQIKLYLVPNYIEPSKIPLVLPPVSWEKEK